MSRRRDAGEDFGLRGSSATYIVMLPTLEGVL
jgi:hypothetical protein